MNVFLRRFSTQIRKQVQPFSKIQINGRLNYDIKPFDLYECQDSKSLRISLVGDSSGKIDVEKLVRVDIDGKTVHINDKQEHPSQLWCLLEVPIKSDIDLKTVGNAKVSNMYSDILSLNGKNLETKNIHSTNINLNSVNGDIQCKNLLLGQLISMNITNGSLLLDKVQGEKLVIKHSNGKIQTNSCYSAFSQFDCNNSVLNLKNIHKLCHINAAGVGELHMNGFYGTLIANIEDYLMNLQLSELIDKSSISCKSQQSSVINLASKVFEECFVRIRAQKMNLHEDIVDLNVSTNGEEILFNENTLQNHLTIEHTNEITLGRLAWADSFTFPGMEELNNKIKSKGL